MLAFAESPSVIENHLDHKQDGHDVALRAQGAKFNQRTIGSSGRQYRLGQPLLIAYRRYGVGVTAITLLVQR